MGERVGLGGIDGAEVLDRVDQVVGIPGGCVGLVVVLGCTHVLMFQIQYVRMRCSIKLALL